MVEASKEDLPLHITKKHDISERNNVGYDEMKMEVEGKVFNVLYKERSQLYRCPVCIAEGKYNVLWEHFHSEHSKTLREVQWEQEIERSEKLANTVFCEICWVNFPRGEDSIEYRNHYSSKQHEQLSEYEEGSGCDICRTTFDPIKEHFTNKVHLISLNYEFGSGCDVCRIPYKNTKDLAMHYRTNRHQFSLSYVNGTGCDMCKIVCPKHEDSNAHKKKVRARDFIYKKFVAPRCKAKSARK